MAAGIERRVDQHVQRHRLEADPAAGGGFRLQRGRELPALRQRQAGCHGDAAAEWSRRIEQHGIPGQVDHVGRHLDPPLRGAGRGEILEGHVQAGRTLRHRDVERVHVHHVARPVEPLAARRDHKSGEVGERPGRAMVARHPLRIQQDQVAGLLHRYGLVHAFDVPHEVGRIDGKRDDPGPCEILRRRDRGRERERLRLPGAGRRMRGEGGRGQEGGGERCVLQQGAPGVTRSDRCRKRRWEVLDLAAADRDSTDADAGETGSAGAEGATAPETLRQKDRSARTSGKWRCVRPPTG